MVAISKTLFFTTTGSRNPLGIFIRINVFNHRKSKKTRRKVYDTGMKKVLVAIIAIVFLSASPVSAHLLGQPPFLKVNGLYAGFYPIQLSSPFFTIPQDNASQHFIVNTPIQFDIDLTALKLSLTFTGNASFRWDFGDGSLGSGLHQTHLFAKPGSYLTQIWLSYKPGDNEIIEAVVTQVLPNASYQLPKAVIAIDSKTVHDPLSEIVEIPFGSSHTFDAHQSIGTTQLTYIWDFGDGTTLRTHSPIVSHTYAAKYQTLFPIVRVSDQNGFYADAYVQIDNTHTLNTASQQSSSTPIKPFFFTLSQHLQQSIRSSLLSIANANVHLPFVFILASVLVFFMGGLHALTPGHGKSMMAAFLTGKKGHRRNDVLLLASSITITHTAVIYMLGFVLLVIDKTASLKQVLPFFQIAGALLVTYLGARMALGALQHHDHGHEHTHSHGHPHAHSHIHHSSFTQLILAGIGGGLIPCADAFALLILLASSGKVGYGIYFVFIFSLGLATTIMLLGFLVLWGKRSLTFGNEADMFVQKYVPIISGIVLILLSIRLLL